jgi:hypothetical protein
LGNLFGHQSIRQPLLFNVLFGRYPEDTVKIDYRNAMHIALEMKDKNIESDRKLSPEFLKLITPILLTSFDLSYRRDRFGRLGPGIILGNSTDFDDLGARLLYAGDAS